MRLRAAKSGQPGQIAITVLLCLRDACARHHRHCPPPRGPHSAGAWGRLGTSQVTVARWESGATEPKFETVREVVAACELDLTLGLATADEGSWTSLIYEQLAREPAERVRHLSRDRFDRVAASSLSRRSACGWWWWRSPGPCTAGR